MSSRSSSSSRSSWEALTPENEAELAYTQQYLQNRNIEDLGPIGCGTSTLISPRIEFTGPFLGTGVFEIQAGLEGSGSSIRLTHVDTPASTEILFPFEHVGKFMNVILLLDYRKVHVIQHNFEEQIFIFPNRQHDDLMLQKEHYQVLIIPTGMAGLSGATRRYPNIVGFDWPGYEADEQLRGTIGESSRKNTDTYYTLLQKALNQQLAPFGKKVIAYADEEEIQDDGDVVECFASLSASFAESYITETQRGILKLLPTGLLWKQWDELYIPFHTIERVHLCFVRDLASETPRHPCHIATMTVMLSITDSPAWVDQPPRSRLVTFEEIQLLEDFDMVECYFKMHDISIVLMQQIYYDYENGEVMTGYLPIS